MLITARCTLVQSVVLRLHVVCLSVRLSVCNVGGSGSHKLEILETNCTDVSVIFRDCAHRAVIFAEAQLSCFCLKLVRKRNTVSHAKIAESSVLATREVVDAYDRRLDTYFVEELIK